MGKAVKENAENFYLNNGKNIDVIHKSPSNLSVPSSLNKSEM